MRLFDVHKADTTQRRRTFSINKRTKRPSGCTTTRWVDHKTVYPSFFAWLGVTKYSQTGRLRLAQPSRLDGHHHLRDVDPLLVLEVTDPCPRREQDARHVHETLARRLLQGSVDVRAEVASHLLLRRRQQPVFFPVFFSLLFVQQSELVYLVGHVLSGRVGRAVNVLGYRAKGGRRKEYAKPRR